MSLDWLKQIKWNEDGLIAVIVQDYISLKVLMVAWANEEAIREAISTGRSCFWSRSRRKLWRKGEESGHYQNIKEVFLDCDGDALLLHVEQIGDIACHTGRNSCFFRKLEKKSTWLDDEVILKSSNDIYGKND
jgi:phosphoribosyl-AMP cyclohydrolase